jgi:hypothetical protein
MNGFSLAKAFDNCVDGGLKWWALFKKGMCE